MQNKKKRSIFNFKTTERIFASKRDSSLWELPTRNVKHMQKEKCIYFGIITKDDEYYDIEIQKCIGNNEKRHPETKQCADRKILLESM